jgi:Lamin Tail Domain
VGFTDGIEYTFQSKDEIKAGEYLVLASNSVRFKERYGFEPFGQYTGKLKNSSETLVLSQLPINTNILSVTYSETAPWPLRADGKGFSLVPQDSTGDGVWGASFLKNGSPGKADPVQILINEVATHTDAPDTDAIELFNPNARDVDIGGWFLSDNAKDLMKYVIPAGTTIKAGGYWVIDAKEFDKNPNGNNSFALSEHGDEVYLSADSSGCATFCHGFAFGAVENGVTLGRWMNSQEEEQFVAMEKPTFGKKNDAPMLSSLVISEIMYHPLNPTGEYVELINVSTDSLRVFDSVANDATWKLKGFGFEFPPKTTLAPNEIVLVLSDSTSIDSFRVTYSIPDSIRIFSAQAKLSNGGDTLALLMPFEPYDDGSGTVVPFRLVERIAYSDNSPWPEEADGLGSALIRKKLKAYGDDVTNWKAGLPTPGRL